MLEVDCAPLEAWAYELRTDDAEGVAKSNIHGYQSKGKCFDEPQLHELREAIAPHVCTATSVITGVNSDESIISLTNTWININEPGSYNKIHTHAIAALSGVFYVKVPEDSGNLIFRRTNDAYILQGVATVMNKANHTECAIKPVEGRLVMFPSWLDHYVEMNESDEDRISIAFNVEIARKEYK